MCRYETTQSLSHERKLVSLYNDVKTIRRSGLNQETINDRLSIASNHWCCELGSSDNSGQVPDNESQKTDSAG